MKFSDKVKGIVGSILPFICAILGALSGADNSSKFFRRFLIPILLTGFSFWNTESIFTLSIMVMSGAFSLGYGLPCPDDPKPSDLGAFWFKICHNDAFLANIFTRGTIGLIVCISLISVPLIKKNWLIYGVCSIIIISTYSFLSWRDLGTYKLFNRQLLVSETVTYFIVGLCGVLINILK